MLHARHTSAFHAEIPRLLLWLQVAGVLASVVAMRVARVCRRS